MLSDRYRVDELVAAGAFGSVYRGVHLHMRKEVAIKILHPEIENFRELVERFEREAIAGAHITHPNVAAATDIGKFDGESYFLVQEYIRGETLRELMERGPLPPARAGRIARQIALALGAAHRHGIIHRDLKPTNVMLVEGTKDFAKLIDFGFARVPVGTLPNAPEDMPQPEWQASEAGVVFGTVKYLAPEAALGMRNVTALSDLYALGIMLFEMLAGTHPFDVNLPSNELFAKHRYAPLPVIAERNPYANVPQKLEAVVRRLTEKEPENRFTEAAEVVGALDDALAGVPGYAVRNNPDSIRPSPYAPDAGSSLSLAGVRRLVSEHPRGFGLSLIGVGVIALLAVHFATSTEEPAAPVSSEIASAPAPPPAASSVAPKESFETRYKRETSAELVNLAEKGKPLQAVDTLFALVELDQSVLAEPRIQKAVVKIALELPVKHEKTDKFFYALGRTTGPHGLDVLYRLIEDDPKTPQAQRAESILSSVSVVERGSPALRVTWELWRSSCRNKRLLFERAGKDGDERTLRLLEPLQVCICNPRRGECCYGRHLELDRAVAMLQEKAGK